MFIWETPNILEKYGYNRGLSIEERRQLPEIGSTRFRVDFQRVFSIFSRHLVFFELHNQGYGKLIESDHVGPVTKTRQTFEFLE